MVKQAKTVFKPNNEDFAKYFGDFNVGEDEADEI